MQRGRVFIHLRRERLRSIGDISLEPIDHRAEMPSSTPVLRVGSHRLWVRSLIGEQPPRLFQGGQYKDRVRALHGPLLAGGGL